MKCSDVFKFFDTHNGHYVYDSFTGRISECDEMTKHVLTLQAKNFSRNSILQSIHGPRFEIEQRIEAIEKLQKDQGVFQSDVRPFRFAHMDDTGRFKDARNIIIEITRRCNLRCKYCLCTDAYPECQDYNSDTVTLETAVRALDLFLEFAPPSKATKSIHASFFGGEPLLESKLMRRVMDEFCQRYPSISFEVHVTTNGTIMTPEILRFLVDYHVNLTISLDGPKHTHDRNRNIDGIGSFDLIMDTLKTMREYCPSWYQDKVSFNCVLAPPFDLDERAHFFAHNPNLPKIRKFRVAQQKSEGLSVKDRKTLGLAHRELDEAWEVYKKRLIDPTFTATDYRSRENSFWKMVFGALFEPIISRPISWGNFDGLLHRSECLLDPKKLYVSPKGILYPCIPGSHLKNRLFAIGSVSEGISKKRIEEVQRVWDTFRERSCSTCWMARICQACFALMPVEEVDEFCASLRARTLKWMTRLAELKEAQPEIIDILKPEEDNLYLQTKTP